MRQLTTAIVALAASVLLVACAKKEEANPAPAATAAAPAAMEAAPANTQDASQTNGDKVAPVPQTETPPPPPSNQ